MSEIRLDELFRVSNRMTACGITGLTMGFLYSVGKGLPRISTATTIGMNCAMVGTACFGLERLSHIALQQIIILMDKDDGQSNNNNNKKENLLYTSHAIGGTFGGAFLGQLFQRRIIPGIVVFTPAMVAIAYVEIEYTKARDDRLRQVQEERLLSLRHNHLSSQK